MNQLLDVVIPRRHRHLLILVLNPDKKVPVLIQVPDLPLTASLRHDIIDIDGPLAITILDLQVPIDSVVLLHCFFIVNEHAEASESVGVAKGARADSIVVYVLKIVDGGAGGARLSLVFVFDIESHICYELVFALLWSKRGSLNGSLLIHNLWHNNNAVLQNK